MQLPSLSSLVLKSIRFLARERSGVHKVGEMVIVDSTVVDAGAVAAGLPRNTILRPGFVLAKGTAGRFYDGLNAAVTGSTPATVTSKIAIGAPSSGLIFSFSLGGPGAPAVNVTMTGVTTTDAAVTALMANIPFAGNAVASNVGGKLQIQTLRCGRQAQFRILGGTFNTQVTQDDTFTSNADAGGATDGDYRVLGLGAGDESDYLEMLGPTAVASNQGAKNLIAGDFVESALIGASAECKAVLAARGAVFN